MPRHKARPSDVVVLDMETDPFDGHSEILPFVAELYAPDIGAIVIWNENFRSFITEVVDAITSLPGKRYVYAHNGGRFDFLFLLSAIKGKTKFKGSSLMEARVGDHLLRDSLHIIPTRLANYHKNDFDYSWLEKGRRKSRRAEILEYLHSDCVYLWELVHGFVERFGFKISIGQAAMSEIKTCVDFDCLSEAIDDQIRPYFFGGRVECLRGAGIFHAPPGETYKVYDVNSMYPYVMSEFRHPVGGGIMHGTKESGTARVTDKTAFIKLKCVNHGALIGRDEKGHVTANRSSGEFCTTIHEYLAALELGKISSVEILETWAFAEWATFEDFVVPLYSNRQKLKGEIKRTPDGPEKRELERRDLFDKFLLNNGYGKFAQDPRRFRDHVLTDFGAMPDGCVPFQGLAAHCVEVESGTVYQLVEDVENLDYPELSYAIWACEPATLRFNNVATGASITGAARSVLFRAICAAKNPIYCDTDSLVCSELPLDLDPVRLGAWDLEAETTEFAVAGKKLYGFVDTAGKEKVRSKGVSGLILADICNIVRGQIADTCKIAPNIAKTGRQRYVRRRVKMTAEVDYQSRALL